MFEDIFEMEREAKFKRDHKERMAKMEWDAQTILSRLKEQAEQKCKRGWFNDLKNTLDGVNKKNIDLQWILDRHRGGSGLKTLNKT